VAFSSSPPCGQKEGRKSGTSLVPQKHMAAEVLSISAGPKKKMGDPAKRKLAIA
jgi:hypothetical protein